VQNHSVLARGLSIKLRLLKLHLPQFIHSFPAKSVGVVFSAESLPSNRFATSRPNAGSPALDALTPRPFKFLNLYHFFEVSGLARNLLIRGKSFK
jgi:hypothetical protein